MVACNQDEVVKSISLNGYSSETPLEFKMGQFSANGYTITVINDKNETQEIPLTEDMISETDKLKFFQEGKNEITISYKGASTSVAINVSRNEFSENVQLKGVTTVYTGNSFTVEVEGDIPGGTKILYPQGNTFQNAGAYDMTAILQCDGYVTKTLTARIVVEKATYDVSNAQLYNETFEYDKNSHGIAVKGKPLESDDGKIFYEPASLPQNVSVSYSIIKVKNGTGVAIAEDKQQVLEGNKAIDAGTYKVCARFKGDVSNYNAIPDSVAYFTIERAAYDMSKVEFLDETVTYSGEEYSLSIAEDSKMPLDVEISYQIKQLKDGAGVAVSDVFKAGNTATNAGLYAVKVSFQIIGKNAENYVTSPFEKEAYLTIQRASYESEMDVYLDSQWFAFEENKTYEIEFVCPLPEGVTPQFTITDENGEVMDGMMQVVTDDEHGENTAKKTYKYLFTVPAAGEYTCVITYKHSNANYEAIRLTLEAWMFIDNKA